MNASSIGWTIASALQGALLDVLIHVLRVSGVATVSALALIVHEEGHRLGARATGRQTAGWGFRWYGAGVRTEVGDLRSFWRVALAGPAASLLMAALLAPALATDIPLAHFAFWVNVLMFLVNLLPFGPSDGTWVMKSLRARRASSTAAPAVTSAYPEAHTAGALVPRRCGSRGSCRPAALSLAADPRNGSVVVARARVAGAVLLVACLAGVVTVARVASASSSAATSVR